MQKDLDARRQPPSTLRRRPLRLPVPIWAPTRLQASITDQLLLLLAFARGGSFSATKIACMLKPIWEGSRASCPSPFVPRRRRPTCKFGSNPGRKKQQPF